MQLDRIAPECLVTECVETENLPSLAYFLLGVRIDLLIKFREPFLNVVCRP